MDSVGAWCQWSSYDVTVRSKACKASYILQQAREVPECPLLRPRCPHANSSAHLYTHQQRQVSISIIILSIIFALGTGKPSFTGSKQSYVV